MYPHQISVYSRTEDKQGKTKIIKIGIWGVNRPTFFHDLNIEWTQKFDCLGIVYDIDKMEYISDLIIEILKIVALWNSIYLTLFGKVSIVKSLLTSRFTHVLLSLPTPSSKAFLALENIFNNFIWNKKQNKIQKRNNGNAPNTIWYGFD